MRSKNGPNGLKSLFYRLNLIPVGYSECWIDFSEKNQIITDIPRLLTICTIDEFWYKMNGPPLKLWEAIWVMFTGY